MIQNFIVKEYNKKKNIYYGKPIKLIIVLTAGFEFIFIVKTFYLYITNIKQLDRLLIKMEKLIYHKNYAYFLFVTVHKFCRTYFFYSRDRKKTLKINLRRKIKR